MKIAFDISHNSSYLTHLDNKIRTIITKKFYFSQQALPVLPALQMRARNFLLRQKSLIAAMSAAGAIVNHCNHMITHHKRHGAQFVEPILHILCHLLRMQIVQSVGCVYKVGADKISECFECIFGSKGRRHFEDNATGVKWEELGIDNDVLEMKKHMSVIRQYSEKLKSSLHGYRFMIQVNKYADGEFIATNCPQRGMVRRSINLTGNERETIMKNWEIKDWMHFFVMDTGIGPMICQPRTPTHQSKLTIHFLLSSGKRSDRRVTFAASSGKRSDHRVTFAKEKK